MVPINKSTALCIIWLCGVSSINKAKHDRLFVYHHWCFNPSQHTSPDCITSKPWDMGWMWMLICLDRWNLRSIQQPLQHRWCRYISPQTASVALLRPGKQLTRKAVGALCHHMKNSAHKSFSQACAACLTLLPLPYKFANNKVVGQYWQPNNADWYSKSCVLAAHVPLRKIYILYLSLYRWSWDFWKGSFLLWRFKRLIWWIGDCV